MATAQERMKILKMVADGKITAEEAAKLLAAISRGNKRETETTQNEPRWFRVKVTDMSTGKSQVNVNLPFGLVQVGLNMGARFVPDMEGVEVEEVARLLKSGMTGKVFDIVDDEEGKRVEIYIE